MNWKILILISVSILFSEQLRSQNILKDVSYVSANETDVYKKERCKLDLSYYEGKTGRPVIIFFHGGGLTGGEKYFPLSYRELNYIEVAPNYRLSPKAKCPAYLEDAAEAIAWVWNNIEKYGGDKRKIIISGASAGAYLAAMMAMDTTYLKKYDINPDNIWIYFTESAQMTTHYTIMAERGINVGSDTKVIDKYAPLYYKRKVKPYVVLATGDRALDQPGRYDQNARMYQMLDSMGVNVNYWEFPGEDHTSMESVAKAKFVEELKKGSFDWPLPSATISADGPLAFCEGGSMTLSASAGSSYQWSTGATTQSIPVTNSGNYTVRVTNARGFAATSAASTVMVNPLPTATISADGPLAFCEGGGVTLTASAGISYLWSTGETTQSIHVTNSGNYSVMVTNASGCAVTSSAACTTLVTKDVIRIGDKLFEPNTGTLYNIMGQKVKDKPTFSDLEIGVIYIYRSESSKCIKIIRRW